MSPPRPAVLIVYVCLLYGGIFALFELDRGEWALWWSAGACLGWFGCLFGRVGQ